MPTEEQVRDALRQVQDPELHLDIVTLGLVYRIAIQGGHVDVEMTFTSVMCPYGPVLVDEVKGKVRSIEGVRTVEVRIVFDPPWKPPEDVIAALGL